MRDVKALQSDYEQGMYTFAEVITTLVCEAQARSPAELIPLLSKQYVEGIAAAVEGLPPSATADDIVISKSGRAHAEQYFEGAIRWRDFFAAQTLRAPD